MRFKLEFNCETAAFDDDLYGEITRILREVSDRFVKSGSPGIIQDYNGNTIGNFRLIGKENRP